MESAMISRETRVCTDKRAFLQEHINDKQRYRLFSIYIPSSFTSLIKIYEIYDYEQIYDYFEQMKMLKSKLVQIAEQQQKEKIEDIKGVQKEIAWGSQIRSYVFHPYNLVKDHRTGFEMGNINAVMDGDLNGFINAYLKAASLGTLETK